MARLPGRCSLGRGRPVQRPRPGPPLRRRGHTEALHTLRRGAVARSRAVVDEALGAGGLDQLGACATRSGERPNLRRVPLDLVEEYARHADHAGHADLIRESVDGLTGEDPPR
ncbi:DUF664 domain-containing protein [Streptomyces virginiae]|uniref:mycothiol transferase n=1 Tax=Streptomyces virginiae TaxID=1961 RepID=UPI00365F02A1